MGVVPAAIYFAVFFLVTYPLLLQFSTHFYTDDKDGLGMIWNVWWINKAVTQLHQSPWHTKYLFYPYGINLFSHTLSPFNGFLSILLLPYLTLTQTYNTLIVFSFVMAGLTTFWLSHYFTPSYWGSVVAGFIFSFSNYHFAHAPGHLNLVSLEWMPLFVLCLYVLFKSPSVRVALAAAACLFFIILCDYYYFFYCVLTAILMFVWFAVQNRNALFFVGKRHLVSAVVFVFASLASSGVIVFKLLVLVRSEPYFGGHEPWRYSTDLLSPFVYGSILRFSHLTEAFWRRLPGNTAENSVYMGVSVVLLLIYTWTQRRKLKAGNLYFWFLLLLFFFVNSLGPSLQLLGKSVPYLPMPYQLLERIFPLLEFSGVPGRMMVMVMLCAAVISAMGLNLLFRSSIRTRVFAGILLAVMFLEFLPSVIKPFRAQVPGYVITLRDLPDSGGVIDLVNDASYATYYSTVYDKPVWTGKIARLPKRLADHKNQILLVAQQGDVDALYNDYGFRYAVLEGNVLYDLKENTICRTDSTFYRP